ncbi:putative ATP-dependent protease La (LON) substrate-binding domain [Lyophyllum shimeji]|uniref:ATP-dependent protease La (LON) substrate-binding domain n=1 Tax=Lyophyllum shimeji TaxID=47721 RepID=A0A9P3PDX9_LYOSH|nr:putative ATP-dependent protease La (LON) substrate-binding domain [Lyophyllum shimeji]
MHEHWHGSRNASLFFHSPADPGQDGVYHAMANDDSPIHKPPGDRDDEPNDALHRRPEVVDTESRVEQANSDPGPPSAGASTTPESDSLPVPDAGPSNTRRNPLTPQDVSLMPHHLLPLLQCPLGRHRLSVPVTLHCGHTICTTHLLTHPRACPVPRCTPPHNASPNIPSSSNVAYFPAAADRPQPLDSPLPSSREDVTIAKVLALLDRTQQALDLAEHPPPRFHLSDDSDSSDDDAAQPLASSSAVAGPSRTRSRSSDSTSRPRKRRRRHPPPKEDDDRDSDGDLLSHLRTESARQRSTRHDQPLLPPEPPSVSPTSEPTLAQFEKDLLTELTCGICFNLFFEPVTTPCQHTFCSRHELPSFLYTQEHPPNKVILSLLLEAFPALHRERGEVIEAEERDARLDTPIFVCQLSFPGMPTLLHFFEPRYRLMLRRCLESPNPCFGMVMPPKPGALSPHMEYGTMLEIRSVQMQPDGRSLVETWGTYRFRILESGTLDGYMVGRIERIDDYPEDITEDPAPELLTSEPPLSTGSAAAPPSASSTSVTSATPSSTLGSASSSRSPCPTRSQSRSLPLPPPRHPSNTALMTQCRTFLDKLERGTAPWIVQRLSSTYGRMPTDVSSFSYWVASILPIDDHEKAKLLPIRSPRLRLLLVVHWIEQLNNNWYTVFYFVRLVKAALLLISFAFFLAAAAFFHGTLIQKAPMTSPDRQKLRSVSPPTRTMSPGDRSTAVKAYLSRSGNTRLARASGIALQV